MTEHYSSILGLLLLLAAIIILFHFLRLFGGFWSGFWHGLWIALFFRWLVVPRLRTSPQRSSSGLYLMLIIPGILLLVTFGLIATVC